MIAKKRGYYRDKDGVGTTIAVMKRGEHKDG